MAGAGGNVGSDAGMFGGMSGGVAMGAGNAAGVNGAGARNVCAAGDAPL